MPTRVAIAPAALLITAMLAAFAARAQNAAVQPPESAASHTRLAVEKPEPTLLSVADEYVKVVGGVITVLGTVLGFPLVYQTFRKTRAEIAKIDLEAAKLRKELGEAGTVVAPNGYLINIEGEHNSVSILTDPRWAAPLLVLVDAFIASIFSTVASFASGFLPLPYLIKDAARLLVYLAIFYPVFRTARQVKKSLGASARADQDIPKQSKELPADR